MYIPPFDAVKSAGESDVGILQHLPENESFSYAPASDIKFNINETIDWNDGLDYYCTAVSPVSYNSFGRLIAQCDLSPALNWGCPFGIDEMKRGFVFNRHWLQPDICNKWDPDCDTIINEHVPTLGDWVSNGEPDWGLYFSKPKDSAYYKKFTPATYDFSYIP